MPRLAPASARVVIKKLKKIGFVKTHQRGSHVFLRNAKEDTIVTVPVHGSKDIPVGTLYNIVIRQAAITVERFNKL